MTITHNFSLYACFLLLYKKINHIKLIESIRTCIQYRRLAYGLHHMLSNAAENKSRTFLLIKSRLSRL